MKKKILLAAARALGAVTTYLYGRRKKESQEPASPDYKNKIILSKNIWREQDTRKTKINNNFLLIGDSGTVMKHFIIPNILEQNSSYIVVDPEGKIYEQVKDKLYGYEIKRLNLSSQSIKGSVPYNPLTYVKTERDVMMIVDCFLSQNGSNGKFGCDLQKILLIGCIFHLLETGKLETGNKLSFKALYDLLDNFSDDLFASDPADGHAVKHFRYFKESATGPAKDAVIDSCITCLEPFRFWGEEDGCNLEELSDRKIALFLIPDAEPNAIANTFIPMLFAQLYEIQINTVIPYSSITCFIQGEEYLKGFDNEDNISFPKSMIFPTYGVDLVFITEKISESDYSNHTGINLTTASSCSSTIYYSSSDYPTLQYVSERIGDEKISFGKGTRTRRIMTAAELLRLPKGKCVVIQENQRTIMDDVY